MVKSTQNSHPEAQGLYTVPQVAQFLALSRSKIYGLMDQGNLPYVKLGKSRRIKWADVLRLVDESTVRGDRSSL
jgi:excisionase family DNA binding protein